MLAKTVRVGQMVATGVGKGKVKPARIRQVYERERTGPIVTIETDTGRKLQLTPEHILFAGYDYTIAPQDEDLHFVYLMEREGHYRVGTTQLYRYGQKAQPLVYGFRSRLNQERGDAIWILRICKNNFEARFWETIYSLRYGIPTTLFCSRNNAEVEEMIDRVFSTVDSARGAALLLTDLWMNADHPHHRPKCMTATRRRNFSVTMCADPRGASTLHQYSISGSDPRDRKALERAGLPVRDAKSQRNGWRLESCIADLGAIYRLLKKVQKEFAVNVIEKARLAKGGALPFCPASHVRRGMVVFVLDGKEVAKEMVTSTSIEMKTTKVYDFDVEGTHNYAADGIFVHNSIYGWRGADPKSMKKIEEDYGATTLPLSICYRCPTSHVALAKKIVPEIEPFEENPEGTISSWAKDDVPNGVQPGDLVICRWNAPLVSLYFRIIRRGKRAAIRGRDIGAGLMGLVDRAVDADAALAHNLPALVEVLRQHARHESQRLLAEGRENTAQLVLDRAECLATIVENVKTIDEVKQTIKHLFVTDVGDPSTRITMSSIHRAKGLESDRVVIVDRDRMPPIWQNQSPAEYEQEQNCLYVALTRAKKDLVMA